jgi:hypothetical protein
MATAIIETESKDRTLADLVVRKSKAPFFSITCLRDRSRAAVNEQASSSISAEPAASTQRQVSPVTAFEPPFPTAFLFAAQNHGPLRNGALP